MDWNPVWSRGFSFFNVSIFQYIFHQFFISTIPITAMGCRQCLSLSVVQLKGKHCRKPHCHNGVVDTFRPGVLQTYHCAAGLTIINRIWLQGCNLNKSKLNFHRPDCKYLFLEPVCCKEGPKIDPDQLLVWGIRALWRFWMLPNWS